ncbi:hypothetical protein D1953_02925 [Peribacillus asahii]|uniref:Uncharacterized protein n=1 Tax=Peribacillus asahii TaxID=228899 RepID=A0A398BEN3_9BACI|nr:hypothetical protein [Peribacillus asahii]RID88685.1 hypothetical protein D1953_02925 [Peribacillus asahii]
MQNNYWLYFLALLAGFAFILLPVAGTIFAGLEPILAVIGIVVVLLFAVIIVWKALESLFKR